MIRVMIIISMLLKSELCDSPVRRLRVLLTILSTMKSANTQTQIYIKMIKGSTFMILTMVLSLDDPILSFHITTAILS